LHVNLDIDIFWQPRVILMFLLFNPSAKNG